MKTKYALFRLFVIGVLYDSISLVHGQIFNDPSFDSDWLPIAAHDSSLAFLEVEHNLGEVPALVEVLVKSTEEPNKDFIFKGIGTAGRDDDATAEYGSVVYIYNDISVRIYAPNPSNGPGSGYTIYTGMPEWWVGVNNQSSQEALVKVRCWSVQVMPASCFETENITLVAGSNQLDETYVEVTHGIGQWPALVSVRALLLDGPSAGWYTDGQGTNTVWLKSMTNFQKTGGLVYGYNDTTVRLWVSSVKSPANVLFSISDGWGIDNTVANSSTTGSAEVRAWCSLGRPTQTAVMLGPGVANEQLEILLPGLLWGDLFVSVKVIPRDGENEGFLFDGIGGAMRHDGQYKQGTPCSYGGVVYGYDAKTLRFWRPADTIGAALCIGSKMGNGINSQATNNVNLLITVWTLGSGHISLRESANWQAMQNSHTGAYRLASDGHQPTDDSSLIAAIKFQSNILQCHTRCHHMAGCLAFGWYLDTCSMYNATEFEPSATNSTGYEIWIME